uniref:Uncharacterized protein n=1 Tax=Ulva partita TaxID=1605170 RepID=A0A1C9ZW89_9CHLO|nr:hypothetical protein [Ulva partita]
MCLRHYSTIGNNSAVQSHPYTITVRKRYVMNEIGAGYRVTLSQCAIRDRRFGRSTCVNESNPGSSSGSVVELADNSCPFASHRGC